MTENHPPPDVGGSPEREHLERAHEEICTALTVLRSNVDLVRTELSHEPPAAQLAVQAHLMELDLAVDRLRRLAAQMRAWRGTTLPPGSEAVLRVSRTRLLP